MIEIRRILCPVDFSEYSRRALDHAIAIARCYEATVTALHVFSPVPVAACARPRVRFHAPSLHRFSNRPVLSVKRMR